MNFLDHEAVNGYTGFLLRKVSSASFEAFSEIVGAHELLAKLAASLDELPGSR